jgi:hypothetical protein
MKMEQTQCYEMLAFKLQTPGNNPEDSIQHSKQDESFKSRKERMSQILTGMSEVVKDRPLSVFTTKNPQIGSYLKLCKNLKIDVCNKMTILSLYKLKDWRQ